MGWGDVDWIGLAQDRNRWRALVNLVLNLLVAYRILLCSIELVCLLVYVGGNVFLAVQFVSNNGTTAEARHVTQDKEELEKNKQVSFKENV
jgi:hypothetical protein